MIKKHTISLNHALEGLFWVLKNQPNYKIHFLISATAIVFGFILEISYMEFLIILFLITVGLTIETINSSNEATTDAIDLSWRQDIKIAKDVSAAAMLVFAVGSTLIAGLIFIPKIILLIF